MAISTSFLAVFLIFHFASFAKNLKEEDDKEFLYLLCALRSANVFPYALVVDVDLSWFLHKPINTNVISFDQALGHFLLLPLTQTDRSSCSSIG